MLETLIIKIMGKKVIITGSTGMVGKAVLIECLESENVESVLVINRHSINTNHPKLKEIIHSDFLNIESISTIANSLYFRCRDIEPFAKFFI